MRGGRYGTRDDVDFDDDDDGYSDIDEIAAGSDPLNPGSIPPLATVPIQWFVFPMLVLILATTGVSRVARS